MFYFTASFLINLTVLFVTHCFMVSSSYGVNSITTFRLAEMIVESKVFYFTKILIFVFCSTVTKFQVYK